MSFNLRKLKTKRFLKLSLSTVLIVFGLYILRYDVSYAHENLKFHCNELEKNYFSEEYSPYFVHVDNIDLAIDLIDIEYSSHKPKVSKPFDSLQYMLTAITFVKHTFFHGNSAFIWQDNWICFLLGKFIWSDFNSIVSPDQVIKHKMAMCSQQTMVFTKIMKLKGYNYRYAYLRSTNNKLGHFCCEIWVDGRWHFVDIDGEPDWKAIDGPPNQSLFMLIQDNKLQTLYQNTYPTLQYITSQPLNISYSRVNEQVGQRMILFQKITTELSWLLPIFLGVYLLRKEKTLNSL